MEVQGKLAIVTGAAQGIGAATAKELARRGARAIALVDLTPAVETQQVIEAAGGKAVVFSGDTTSEEFRRSVYGAMEAEFGDVVRILVPAAGITRDGLSVKVDKVTGKAAIYDEKKFDLVINVNLKAPTYWAIEMARRVAEARFVKFGKVTKWDCTEGAQAVAVLIGSISSEGNMGQVSYSATKAGLCAVASTLRQEWRAYGILTKVVHPGFTRTPMVAAMPPEVLQRLVDLNELGRLIEPEEIANIIAHLVQDDVVQREVWADGDYHSPR